MVARQPRMGIKSLPKIESRGSIAADATASLRKALLTGVFADGEHLNLSQLAKQLGVSMMPVREALVVLANEGLVVSELNKGFRATPPDEQDFDDVYALHAHISGLLAHRAAVVITDDELAVLKQIHNEFEQTAESLDLSVSHPVLEALNNKFHRLLNSIGEGNRLRWFLRSTTSLMGYVNVQGWCGATLHYHPRIIAALEARDAVRAAKLVENHFLQGVNLLHGAKITDDDIPVDGVGGSRQ